MSSHGRATRWNTAPECRELQVSKAYVVSVGFIYAGADPPNTKQKRNGNVMDENEVFRRVKKVVAAQLNVDQDQITLEASFIGDLGADNKVSVP